MPGSCACYWPGPSLTLQANNLSNANTNNPATPPAPAHAPVTPLPRPPAVRLSMALLCPVCCQLKNDSKSITAGQRQPQSERGRRDRSWICSWGSGFGSWRSINNSCGMFYGRSDSKPFRTAALPPSPHIHTYIPYPPLRVCKRDFQMLTACQAQLTIYWHVHAHV